MENNKIVLHAEMDGDEITLKFSADKDIWGYAEQLKLLMLFFTFSPEIIERILPEDE